MNNIQSPKYNFLSYSQPGAVFYACTIPAKDIITRLEIRRRSQDREIGIQRDESQRRVAEIAEYASERDSILPTPIIVSANSDTVYIDGGSLSLSTESKIVGHILDGQHRVLGLRQTDESVLASYDLLVVFVFDIDPYAEATIFATINGNQKQVSKSLMYDLFELNPGRSIEKTCHEIVRSLNDDEHSPFFQRIKLLGKKMGEKETLSQAAFIDQVKRQVKDEKGPLFPFYKSGEDWAIRKVVSNCFSAINMALERNKTDFPQDYFFRTTGFGGVVQALNDLVKQGKAKGDVSEQYFLSVMSNFFEKHPTPPAGVGNAAMLKIKNDLLDSLPQ